MDNQLHVTITSLKVWFSGGNKGRPKQNRVQDIYRGSPLQSSTNLCRKQGQSTVANLWKELKSVDIRRKLAQEVLHSPTCYEKHPSLFHPLDLLLMQKDRGKQTYTKDKLRVNRTRTFYDSCCFSTESQWTGLAQKHEAHFPVYLSCTMSIYFTCPNNFTYLAYSTQSCFRYSALTQHKASI